MPRPIPPPSSVTLTVLRSAQGWTQTELAAATGISKKTLSLYETGRRALSQEVLVAIAAVLGFGPEVVDLVLACVQAIRPERGLQGWPVEPTESERRRIERTAADAAKSTRSELTRSLLVGRVGQARRQAGEQWEYLRGLPAWARRVLVEGAREYQSWSLCERLCAESERAAADDAARALELASLALRVAEMVPGPEAQRSRLQGYAWGHLGNARRVASDLPGADEAFSHARRLWEAGAPGDPNVLSEGRLFDLEASLRRAQRRWEEAVSLHDRALAKAPAADHGSILLNKAFTLQQKGDFERAIETLLTVGPLLDGSREPRLSCVLRFNLAANLSQLGRHEEAEELLPEVRRLAMGLGNGLDLVRLRWLEGRCAAGMGRSEEALVALSQVREDFTSRGIAYDAALATLELAVLYLEQGRTGEVRRLARQMTPIFKAQGVHREALAALKLFCEAAEQEAITVELARRLADYLERARHEPELRFEI